MKFNNRFNSVFIFILTTILLLGNLGQVFAGALDYTDISGTWAENEISDLINQDIMDGYDDNTIKPYNLITRAEFSKILVTAMELKGNSSSNEYFSDVKQTDWFYEPVTILKELSIIDGYDDNSFKPNRNISRAEMIAMIVRVSKDKLLLSNSAKLFKDINIKHWAYWDIYWGSKAGIIVSMGDYLKPNEYVTRAEVAYSIDKTLWNTRNAQNISPQELIDFINNYNNLINDKYNSNNSDFDDIEQLSYGSQFEKLASITKKIELYKRLGITVERSMVLSDSKVLGISDNLAQISFIYNLSNKVYLRTGSNVTTKQGFMTYYLKRFNNDWFVYSEQDSNLLNNTNKSEKINLTWDQLGRPTDIFKGGIIEELDVISPTWFSLSDSSGNVDSIASEKYVLWAHNNGYKVWALFDNNFDPVVTSEFMNNPYARNKAINKIVQYAADLKLDGINVDFENMYTKDKDMFTQFIKELSAPLKARGITLSIDVTFIVPNSNWSSCYDRKALAQIVDYVAVMAYDQHWAASPKSGSVAQISWVENGLIKILSEVPSNKVLLGVPFYTREWKEVVTAEGTKVTSRAISMSEAERVIKENAAQKVWDVESGQYYAQFSKDGAVYKIWLEDAKSIGLKSELVKKYNLAGIASWRVGFETSDVWNVIKNNISNN